MLQLRPATRLPLAFFKALAVSCFPRQLQSLPPTNGAGKDRQQVNMTEGCSLLCSPSLARQHARSPPPLGENTSLTSLLERKSYLSCGRCCRYGLILDGRFQVLRFTTALLRSFKSSKKGKEKHLQKECFSPGELAVIFLMCPLAI